MSLRDRNSPLIDTFLLSRYQAVAEQAKDEKLIRRPVSIEGWFEPSYLQTALKAKGLENFWTAYGADGKQPTGNTVAGK